MDNKISSFIERAPLIEVIDEFKRCSCLSWGEIDFLDEFRSAVESSPVEFIKEGHWCSFQGGFECSLCNYSVIADDVDDMFYCPNCGAKLINYLEKKDEE